jgi:hypothetical protein
MHGVPGSLGRDSFLPHAQPFDRLARQQDSHGDNADRHQTGTLIYTLPTSNSQTFYDFGSIKLFRISASSARGSFAKCSGLPARRYQ